MELDFPEGQCCVWELGSLGGQDRGGPASICVRAQPGESWEREMTSSEQPGQDKRESYRVASGITQTLTHNPAWSPS